jgi:toxin ParE1/3/4
MDTCSRIADNPMIGSKYLKDNGEYELYFKAKKHFIFYNVVEGEVNIHRILHENMDLENRLKE